MKLRDRRRRGKGVEKKVQVKGNSWQEVERTEVKAELPAQLMLHC